MKYVAALIATASLTLVAPTPSPAADGTYTQILCMNPDTGQGVGAPEEIGRNGGAPFPHLTSECDGPLVGNKGIVLQTGLPVATTQGQIGELAYTAPAGVTVEAGHVYRVLRAAQQNNHLFTMSQHGGAPLSFFDLPRGETFQWFVGTFLNSGTTLDPLSSQNRVDLVISPNGKIWRYTGGCDAPNCSAQPGAVSLRIFGGKLSLSDDLSPELVGTVSGSLAQEGVLSGDAEASLSMRDAGAGVYKVRVLVDGVLRAEQLADKNGGKCEDINKSNIDPFEFRSAAPCKLATSSTIRLDTSSVPDGRHNLRVDIIDAAGNVTPALNRMAVIDNLPDALATSGGSGAQNVPLRLTFTLSRRSLINGQILKYSGRLTAPNSGHKFVEVQVRQGRRWQVVCSVQTDSAGNYGCRHRFRRTVRRTRYVFRARVRSQSGLGNRSAVSRLRSVVVKPTPPSRRR